MGRGPQARAPQRQRVGAPGVGPVPENLRFAPGGDVRLLGFAMAVQITPVVSLVRVPAAAAHALRGCLPETDFQEFDEWPRPQAGATPELLVAPVPDLADAGPLESLHAPVLALCRDGEEAAAWASCVADVLTLPVIPVEARGRLRTYLRQAREQHDLVRTRLSLHAQERTETARVEFLSIISHELRTPLNVINGFGQLLQETPLDRDQTEYLRLLLEGSRGLSRLVEEMVQFVSGSDSTAAVVMSPTVVGDLVRDLGDEFGRVARDKGLAFACEIDPEIPDPLLTDATLLTRVFRNLLSNAVKFTPAGRVSVTLRLDGFARLERDGKLVRWPILFEVADTGVGIPPEHLQAIFRPFRQVESPLRRRFEGAGLGLAVVDRLCSKIGARVSVDSVPDRGSTFAVRFLAEAAPEG